MQVRSKGKWLVAGLLWSVCLSVVASDKRPAQDSAIPLDQLKAFAETYWQIKQSYVKPVDDKQLIESAINGMLQSLDPYSSFLSESDLQDLRTSATGNYDGLGVEISTQSDQVVVLNTLLNSPAERAGILSNDVITAVNQQQVAQVGAEKALELMRGKAGDRVALTIRRIGQEDTLDFDIELETLEQVSVAVTEQPGHIWHIRVSIFQRDTGYELAQRFREATRGRVVKGAVLDLRSNPGGVLRAAVDVADLWLSDGIIVSTKGRTADSHQRYYANPGDSLEALPLVVLIDETSASASEIVAGALQDHQRAVVIGQTSYGKGVVQSVVPLRPNMAIKLTTSHYFTPNGRSIDQIGIEPDIDLSVADEVERHPSDYALERAVALLTTRSVGKL